MKVYGHNAENEKGKNKSEIYKVGKNYHQNRDPISYMLLTFPNYYSMVNKIM